MEDQEQTSFTFEIDNFLEKESVISSPNFLSGGCEWVVEVYPKGMDSYIDDHLSLALVVANPETLRLGWKRRANFSLVLLNQSGKVLYRFNKLFCAHFTRQGNSKTLPLKKLQEKGFLENNKLIVKVEVKVVEVVDESDVTGNEMLDVDGFQVLYTQAISVNSLFTQYPDIAENFRPKSQLVKTAYMNLLLGLIETLDKPPHSISDTELSNAHSELIELTEAGFKLDWLKKKLNGVYLERKKENVDVSPDQEFKEEINNAKSIAKDLLEVVVHSWNEWKVRLGFAHPHSYEKVD
ncbi:MATH domain and coiled-coil domain-containing protein At2g42470 [Eutrema salsugineum]|uniref:MATH domain and coiled-coil domain-containing protein At2g42470 n=1 Tax=Eutrema salsugineum TaxID=72664 RepID=UPI000CED0F2A|nr:MATH domain and coiled-coil domain-containing protein At2g42470 [Eutrema salsugineum]